MTLARSLRLRLVPCVLMAAACADAGPEITIEVAQPASADLLAGDFLTLTATATSGVPAFTWTTSDDRVATVSAGVVEALRPGTVTITASAPGALSGDIDLTVSQRPGGYSADEVDYFAEIAFGAEFGTSSPLLRRWPAGSGPLIRINGSPSAGDLAILDDVVAEINALAPVDIEIVSDFPTAEMHFVPQSEFSDILPDAPPGNIGLVWLWWDVGQNLNRSVVLISSTTEESIRAHIIREEVTQMLGLLRDSFSYPQSIFYQPFSTVTEYTPIDRAVIELLYRPELSVGMGVLEAQQVARTLVRATPSLASSVPAASESARTAPWGATRPPGAVRGRVVSWVPESWWRPGSGGSGAR